MLSCTPAGLCRRRRRTRTRRAHMVSENRGRTDGPAVELPARNVADTACTAVVSCRRVSSMQVRGVFFPAGKIQRIASQREKRVGHRRRRRPPSFQRPFEFRPPLARRRRRVKEMRSIACLSISEYGLGSGPFYQQPRTLDFPAPPDSNWPSSALTNPSGQMIRLGLSAE